MKLSTIKSRFLDWFLSVSLKNACEWLFKWGLLWSVMFVAVATVCFVGMDSLEWDSEDGTTIFSLVMGVINFLYLPITYVFNYILADRVLQVKNKKTVLICFLTAAYIVPFLNLFVSEYSSHNIKLLSTIFLLVFYALIIWYGNVAYRKAIWFVLYAIVLRALGESVLTLLAYIAFYVKLYLTAKKCNM